MDLLNQREQFFELLKYSNSLTKKNKFLYDENRIKAQQLSDFLIIIENNVHYSERKKYLDIARDFLANKLTPYDFSLCFMGIYEGINNKISEMKKNEALELANWLNSNELQVVELLARMYGCCDDFNVDSSIADEKELKSWAKTLIEKLQ